MKKITVILLILISGLTNAQILKVSSDKNPAIVGEQILIQYSIDAKAENFKSPQFKDFQLLSGPNPSTQSSYSFINGKSESTVTSTYSFYIRAINEGNYNIPPAKITVDGKEIESNPYVLKVVKGSDKNQNQKQSLTNNLFIKVSVSKSNITVGEQILVTYKLYTRVDLQNTEISSVPALNGFWAKDLEISSRFKRDILDGVAYNVATVKKAVLTAQKSGKLEIDPIKLKCSIRIQNKRINRDPFANFFGGSYNIQEEIIRSKSIFIDVKDLPTPPSNFSGAVGYMSIESEIDKATIDANDAINYKLTITGTGNIELIKKIDLEFPENFEVYEPKISEKIFKGGLERSIKTFEYLLIPRYQGKYTIPSAKLVVYNPVKKIYQTKTSSQHELKINTSKNNEYEKSLTSQENIENNIKDINYIFLETNLNIIGKDIIPKTKFYLLLFFPVFVLVLLNVYYKIIRGKRGNKSDWKNRIAKKIAQKRLKKAKQCIENSNFDIFFEEIEKSLWGYFADKFKVDVANLSKETISKYFNNSKINPEIENQFILLLNECEFARYAPDSNKNTQMDNILTKAQIIIIEVETALK